MRFFRRRNNQILILIGMIALVALWVVLTEDIHLSLGGASFDRKGMRLGLDLQGGTHLVYQADNPDVSSDDMKGLVITIRRRIDAYGVIEPIVQQMGNNRILIQLPGVKNIEEAKGLIGQTARLDFREIELGEDGQPVLDEEGNPRWVPAEAEGLDGEAKQLEGKYLKSAAVVMDPNTSLPQVAIEWDNEGSKLFEAITTRLIGRPLGIFLDDQLISAPTVRTVITRTGVIENMTLEEAQRLTILLNGGRLPVSISLIQEQDVDATLGADSIKKSLLAGEIGLSLVLLFMVLYYRLPGVLASVSLLVYAALVLSVFKLMPVTLTLAGIAAFILSIGMAVDANILIFERLKEEIRAGRTLGAAIEAGFARAWPSIRDSNVSTFITCGILYWFGDRLGASLVMGFAVTLFIGVAISMFTAIVITRTFLRSLVGTPLARRLSLFVG